MNAVIGAQNAAARPDIDQGFFVAIVIEPNRSAALQRPEQAHRTARYRTPAVHSRTSGPFAPITGSVLGTATSGIVFIALAWASGDGRTRSIGGPGG